jgi:hypothetical protein
MKTANPFLCLHPGELSTLSIVLLWIAYAFRTLLGEGIEPILLLVAVVAGVANASMGSLRNPFWIASLLLSLHTLLVMLLPHRLPIGGGFEIAPLPYTLPAWAVSELDHPVPRIHLAPWEGVRWVSRFMIAGWMILALDGKRRILEGFFDRLWLGMMILFSLLVLIESVVSVRSLPFSQVNPNHKAVLLLMGLPTVSLLRGKRGRALVGILLFSGILATKAFGATLLAALFFPFLLRDSLNLRTLFLTALAGILIGGAGLWIGSSLLLSESPVSLVARTAIFQQAFQIFAERPLFGIGFGAYPWIAPLFPIAPGITPSVRILHPENEYLWLLTEGGILAVLLILLPLLFVPPEPTPSGRGARGSLLLLAFIALWDHPLSWGGVFFSLPYYLVRGFAARSSSELLKPPCKGENLCDQLHPSHPPQKSR